MGINLEAFIAAQNEGRLNYEQTPYKAPRTPEMDDRTSAWFDRAQRAWNRPLVANEDGAA